MMKNVFNKGIKNEKICLFVSVVLICFCVLCNIDKLNLIYIIGDEFGYWANAATFAGLDWKEVISCNPYYSYGWSVFLVPILLLTHNPAIMYKMAIGLNAFFLCGSFFLAYNCGKQLFVKFNRTVLCFICLVITLYSSNIYQAQNTQSEIILYFWFWLLVWLLLKCLKKNKYSHYVVFGCAGVYMYVIHMRNLGVCIAAGMVILLMFLLKKDVRKKVVPLIVFVILGFVFATIVKDYLMDNVYINKQMASINDYSGQVGKLEILMTIRGVKLLIANVVGRIFYLGNSTFFIIYWGLLSLLKRIVCLISQIKNRAEISNINILSLFILLAFLGSLGISSISMIEVARMDTLIYGRYMDILVGPILLFGFIELFQSRSKLIGQMIFIICHAVCSVAIVYTLNYFGVRQFFPGNVPGIVGLVHNGVTAAYIYFPYVVAMKVIIISCIFALILKINVFSTNKKQIVVLVATACLWIYLGIFMTVKHTYLYQETSKDYLISDMVNNTDVDDGLYYVKKNSKTNTPMYVDYIQFLLPEIPLKTKTISELRTISDNAYILLDKDTAGTYIKENYFKVTTGSYFDLYVKNGSDLSNEVISILSQIDHNVDFNLMYSRTTEEKNSNYIDSNGNEGYLLFGPYMELDKGKYEAIFDIDLLDTEMNGKLGYVDIMAENGQILAKKYLYTTDIQENGEIALSFESKETLKNVEFRVYVQAGAMIRVNSITYTLKGFVEE